MMRSPVRLSVLLLFLSLVSLGIANVSYAQDGNEPIFFDSLTAGGVLTGTRSEVPLTATSCDVSIESAALAAPVTVVRDSGPSSNRVDVVLLGDGYTQAELGTYSANAGALLTGMFQQAPLYEYTNYFNVHRVDLASNESGVDNDPTNGVLRDTALDSQFWCQGVPDTMCTNVTKAWQYAALSRDADQIIVLANSATSGAAAYPFSDLAIVSARQGQAVDSLLHQFGHSFANLADEYDTGGWPTYTGFEPAEPNVSAQTSASMTLQQIKWYRWLGVDLGAQYGGVIGTYQGAMGHQFAIYRPTADSKMRTLTAPFNGPSIESFLGQIYRIVSPIDDATPASSTLTGKDTLMVKPMQPIGRNLSVQWYLNGTPVAGATGNTFRANNYRMNDGTYTVSVIVADNTSFMRDEAFRAQRMTASRSWSVAVDENVPVIVTQPANALVYVNQSATFSVVAQGDDLTYQWYKNGSPIPNATASSYTTPAAVRADSGNGYSVVVTNIAGSVTSSTATLTVGNRLPSLSPIPSQQMNRSQTRTVLLSYADMDFDALIVSASIDSQPQMPGAQVTIENGSVKIVTNGTYLGTFNITVTVSDGIASVNRTFGVSVSNQLPTITPIPNQAMNWRTDSISVPILANDLDGDALVYSAQVDSPGGVPVVLSLSGNQLTINPDANYLGTFSVKVSASDGLATAWAYFNVTVYNNAPVVAVIPDQAMHWKTDSITVPFSASDPDGDPLSYSTSFYPLNTPVSVSLNGSNIIINPADGYLGTFNVILSAADSRVTTSRSFQVRVYNNAPILAPIPDQKMHWILDDTRMITLSASDPDNEPLTYSAEVLGNVAPMPVLTLNNNQLTIDPAYRYLGTFIVRVSVTDGTLSDSRTFSVTSLNNAPDLQPICDRSISWSQLPYSVQLQAADPDGESLTYSASVEYSAIAYQLDQIYNFSKSSEGWLYNLQGLGEKYLLANKNTGSALWYMILPNGSLYQMRGSVASSTLIATLPTAYYLDPTLLIDVPATPSGSPPVTVSTQGSQLIIDAPQDFRGSVLITARASDGYLFDQEAFVATIYDGSFQLDPIDTVKMHWREDSRTIQVAARDNDGNQNGNPITYTATFANTSQAYNLSQTYQFRDVSPRTSFTADNARGRGEKYIVGVNNTVFALLPNGELYSCTGGLTTANIDTSTFVTRLPAVYYTDPSLLFDAYPDAPSPIALTFQGDKLTIDPETGFTGKSLVTVTASNGVAQDSQTFEVEVYDTAPVVTHQSTFPGSLEMSWRTDTLTSNISLTDADSPDQSSLTATASLNTWDRELYALDQIRHFAVRPAGDGLNESGWRERHLTDMSGRDYAILPNNGLYEWHGSFSNSTYLMTLPAWNAKNVSTLINPPAPTSPLPNVQVSYANGVLTIHQVEYGTTLVNITIAATDGYGFGRKDIALSRNVNRPFINPIDDISRHRRLGAINVPVQASDLDGETVRLIPLLNLPGTPAVKVPATLTMNGTTLNISTAPNYTGTFRVYLIGTINPTGTPSTFDINSVYRSFLVTIFNNAPYLAPTGPKQTSYKGKLTTTISASDPDWPDANYLTYSAWLGTYADLVYKLAQQYHFYQDPAGWNNNAGGYGELYFLGTVSGIQTRFVMFPNGEIYQYPGSFPVTNKIAHVSRFYFDYPTLLFNPAPPPALPDFAVSMAGTALTVDSKGSSFNGTIPVTVEVGDGNLYVSDTFNATFVNNAPVISAVGNQTKGWRESFTTTVTVTDADNDATTLTAAPATSSASLINVSVSGKTVTVTPKTPFVGTATVVLTASDGTLSSQSSFNITYVNRAPVLNAIPAQTMRWNEKTRTLQLSATDIDNDTITYTAAVTYNTQAATVAVSGKALTITLQTYMDSFFVTAYASDGVNQASQTFKVTVTNSAPVIGQVPMQTTHWTTEKIVIPLSVTDPDGDAVSITAGLQAGSSFPVVSSVQGSTLTLWLTDRAVGSFVEEIRARDQLTTSVSSFLVKVTNGAPVMYPVADQVLTGKMQSAKVTLRADDPDSDPLTYSATVLNAGQLAYELDKVYNFELRYGDYYYNKLGNNEKYIQGTKNSASSLYWYVIYPNGRLYEWTGQLSTSTYITTVPSDFYNDPSKLFNVVQPSATTAPAQLSVSGTQLTIAPQSGYYGRFWIKAQATDTRASDQRIFSVEVMQVVSSNEDGDDDDNDGECTLGHESHHGDYKCNGKTVFRAEGRIGDSTGGSSARTHELCVGDSSGNFVTGEKANYVWKNGVKTAFSITYDPDHSSVNFVHDGVTVSHATGKDLITDILLRTTNDCDSADSVLLENLKLNGEPLSDTVGSSTSLGHTNVLQIRSGLLNKKFTLEGSVTMRYGSNSKYLPKDSDLGFQISFNSVEGHKTECGDDGGRKITICHIPPGNPGNAHTISISRSALTAHLSHGDVIGECPGAPADPGDGGGTCEQKKIIQSPNYTLWNGFLNMTDILELTNPTLNDMPVKISFFSINGALAHQITVTVPAVNQRDVILNEFPGFLRDSYGVVKLEFNGPLDGRMMYYRQSSDGAGYDFAFDMPLADANFGTTAVSFNTFQPSQKPEERNNLVANWLSIVNLDSSSQSYTVNTYSFTGDLILRRRIEVAPFGRADVDGGHDLAGPNVVGVHVIIPDNVTAEYIAQLTRFGGDAPAGFAPSKYKFAFPLSAKLGQSDPIYTPISTKFNEYNWIEVVNILDKEVGASINLYARDGSLLESVDATLQPHAQLHFNAADYLPAGQTGYASIVPREPYSLIAQSMGYLREPVSNGVTAVYGSQARRALPCLQSGSYNLFLNMQDWLLVANTTNDTVTAKIQLTGPTLQSEKALTLAPRASVYLPIHDVSQFGAQKDTYGLIAVTPTDTSIRLFAEVMRVRYRANGTPDFAAPTPVR
ncbi:MAG: M64 family metallopeptidase [Bdellovibrionota bacterium]